MLADIEVEIVGYLRMVIFDSSVLIERDTDLLAAGLDSIALLNLLLFIEKQYDVCIPEETITEETIRSVKNIAALIYALMPPNLTGQA
jgi:acyl carrier protein